MAKEIIPNKLITAINTGGILKDCVLHYQIKTDGVLDKKFYTLSVKGGISIEDLQKIINDGIAQAKVSEGIGEE